MVSELQKYGLFSYCLPQLTVDKTKTFFRTYQESFSVPCNNKKCLDCRDLEWQVKAARGLWAPNLNVRVRSCSRAINGCSMKSSLSGLGCVIAAESPDPLE